MKEAVVEGPYRTPERPQRRRARADVAPPDWHSILLLLPALLLGVALVLSPAAREAMSQRAAGIGAAMAIAATLLIGGELVSAWRRGRDRARGDDEDESGGE